MDFEIKSGFPDQFKRSAAELYFEAFQDKIGGILGREGRGVHFVESVIDPSHSISAVSHDGQKLLGIAGFKTHEGAMVGGELSDLSAIYGMFGGLWRGVLLSLIERDLEDDLLLMDGIAISSNYRRKGVGTKLMMAVIEEAKKRKKKRVRLDVIDINPRARALYERIGFQAKDTEHMGPLRYIFGFRSATRMELNL